MTPYLIILEVITLSFFFFPSLNSCDKVSSRFIYYILDFFFLEYGLSKVDSLRIILEVVELLSLILVIVVLISHFADLDDLEEGKKCNIRISAYIGSHNLIK